MVAKNSGAHCAGFKTHPMGLAKAIVVSAGCFRSKIGVKKYSRQPPFSLEQYNLYIPAAIRTALSDGFCHIWGML